MSAYKMKSGSIPVTFSSVSQDYVQSFVRRWWTVARIQELRLKPMSRCGEFTDDLIENDWMVS